MIVDCFTYMNEREVLLARLEYLKDTVDLFVIVEADMTFQGEPRELDFPKVRPDVMLPESQIRYVVVNGLPVDRGAWECERKVRDAILDGLTQIDEDALILIGDVDEIINRDRLITLASEVVDPVALKLRYFTYKVDWEWMAPWTKPRALRRRDLVSPDALRRERNLPVIDNAGWHLSWLGGEIRVRNKIEAFSHTEIRDLLRSPQHLRTCLALGVDMLGRGVLQHVKSAEAFPGFPRASHPTLWAPARTSQELARARIYNFAIPGLRWLHFPTNPLMFAVGALLSIPIRSATHLRRLLGAARGAVRQGLRG